MNGTKYEKADQAVEDMIIKILTKYNQKFGHLRTDMFINVFKLSEKSSWDARIRLNSGFMRVVVDKPVILEIWRESWDAHTEKQRALTIYHELCHLTTNEKTGDLKLQQHDVQDFKECIEKFGLNGEKIEDII